MIKHLVMVRSGAFHLEEDSEVLDTETGCFIARVGVVLGFRD